MCIHACIQTNIYKYSNNINTYKYSNNIVSGILYNQFLIDGYSCSDIVT